MPHSPMNSPDLSTETPPLLVNGQPHPVPAGGTLQALLEPMGVDRRKGVAVAVNDVVVPRREWPRRIVMGGESVIVIQATQGG